MKPEQFRDEQAVYEYAEAVADLADNFARTEEVPDDSREKVRLIIAWADEFTKKNRNRVWIDEYMEEIDEFFKEKYDEWMGVPRCYRGSGPNENREVSPAPPKKSEVSFDHQPDSAPSPGGSKARGRRR